MLEEINLEWSFKPKDTGEYTYLEAKFNDFDYDGKDELILFRSEHTEWGNMYIYKVSLTGNKASLKLNWKAETGNIVKMINLRNNMLIQEDKETTSHIFVLGYQKGQITTKWECEYKYDKYLVTKFLKLENKGVYVKINKKTWRKLDVTDGKVILSKPERMIVPYLDNKYLTNLAISEQIDILNLNKDKELEKIKRIENYPKETYKIYSPVSESEKFSMDFDENTSTDVDIIGYIPSIDSAYPKVILSNDYMIHWKGDQFIYEPWLSELSAGSGKKELFNFINKDIDNDGHIESLLVQKLDSNWETPFKVKLWIIDYDE